MRTDGFYCSGPVEWEDWHAGVHMHEIHYHFWRFYPNGNWVHCYRETADFAFWEFTESLTAGTIDMGKRGGSPLIENGLQLFTAGTYVVENDILTTSFEDRIPLHPSGEHMIRVERKWQVAGEKLVPFGGATRSEELRFIAPATPDPTADQVGQR